jgi:hypothetical protein
MTLCKLTNENNKTYNNTQWGEGVTHTASEKGELCGSGWIHYYDSPLLAVLLNPIHADFINPHLWSIKVDGEIKKGHDSKFGTTSLTTIERIPLPEINPTQKIIFGILCAMEVYNDKDFQDWGERWIDGSDRSVKAAETAKTRAELEGRAVEAKVKWAARAAANSAFAAELAARVVARTAKATESNVARNIARDVAWVAELAAKTAEIDFHTIAEKAMTYGR